MGYLHYELRILGRYSSLRYSYFGGALSLQSALSSTDLSVGRGDDGLCGYDCGALSHYPLGPTMVRSLAYAIPERASIVAELPFATSMGRIRGINVFHYFRYVLLRRAHSRYRRCAGSSYYQVP